MLASFPDVSGIRDTLDLKILLLTEGVSVSGEVYQAFGGKHRISVDPRECNGLILPDQTVVHMADIGSGARFQLTVGAEGKLQLLRDGEFVTEVFLPKATDFYKQTSSRGTSFRGLAVLEGHDLIAFPFLWGCAYTRPGLACKFCHCAILSEPHTGASLDLGFRPQDVADAIFYAVRTEGAARHVELTGGSTFAPNGECAQMVEVLKAIDETVGVAEISGDIHIYTTPPKDPKAIDALFEAGADRVSCNIEVWDETLSRQIIPGKEKFVGRQRHLDTLLYVAESQGAYKGCCTLVVGLEPAESFLEGAEYLAANGVVPLASVLMPHWLPKIERGVTADGEFYREVKQGLAAIYDRYQCEPPGDGGSHVSIARDVWNHRAEILAGR